MPINEELSIKFELRDGFGGSSLQYEQHPDFACMRIIYDDVGDDTETTETEEEADTLKKKKKKKEVTIIKSISTGFIVIYALDMMKHYVVPLNWIQFFDYETHLMNSLNRNQPHTVFFSSKAKSRREKDGSPKINYEPKFNIPAHTDAEVDIEKDWEGVLRCQLRRYFRKLFGFHAEVPISLYILF